jgi:hypothetical protein
MLKKIIPKNSIKIKFFEIEIINNTNFTIRNNGNFFNDVINIKI